MSPAEHYFENCLFRLARGDKEWERQFKDEKYYDTNIDYLSNETKEAIQLSAWYVFDNICYCDVNKLKTLLEI